MADLFSRNRRSLSIPPNSFDDFSQAVSVKLGRLSVGSAQQAKSGFDDLLLSSTEGGKNDYDWLLTPPGTPLFPSSDGSESQPASMAPRSRASARSVSTSKASRDIRNGNSGTRQLIGTTLFPQSIRSANSKSQTGRATSAPASVVDGNQGVSSVISENVIYLNRYYPENGNIENKYHISSKLREVDIYESSRYDAILLKEDLKNTNWLHSADGKSDQGPIFDNGFEHLPEPFGPL